MWAAACLAAHAPTASAHCGKRKPTLQRAYVCHMVAPGQWPPAHIHCRIHCAAHTQPHTLTATAACTHSNLNHYRATSVAHTTTAITTVTLYHSNHRPYTEPHKHIATATHTTAATVTHKACHSRCCANTHSRCCIQVGEPMHSLPQLVSHCHAETVCLQCCAVQEQMQHSSALQCACRRLCVRVAVCVFVCVYACIQGSTAKYNGGYPG